MEHWDSELTYLAAGVLGVLVVATVVGLALRARAKSERTIALLDNLNQRTVSWWVMTAIFAASVLTGSEGSLVLFGFVSFFALREFITLTPTRRSDHRSLLWAFFVITPLQYYFIAQGWYGMFSIFVPVYAFVLIPISNAVAGDSERFLERTAEVQWGLMVCVFMVSHAPALLTLHIPGYEDQDAKLLAYLVIVVQGSDVLQYAWGNLAGRHKIAPRISPNKTWEGFIGGAASATLIGTALWWLTPFQPAESAVMALAITLMGFFGGLTMSAIKRDRGVKDFGTLIQGHGGMMDRIDSLCFAAPVFFHLTRYFFEGARSFPFSFGP